MISKLRVFLILLCGVLFCDCSSRQIPSCRVVPLESRAPAASLIEEARQDWQFLSKKSNVAKSTTVRRHYNANVAKLFDQLRCGPGTWESRAAKLGTRISVSDPRETNPSYFDALIPASKVRRNNIHEDKIYSGVGISVVGWRQTSPVGKPRPRFYLPNGIPYNVSVTLSFDQGLPTWHFYKRWKNETVKVGNTSWPLRADWTASGKFYWQMCELDDLTLQNVLLPDRFTEETGIYFVTPYDPNKIPIVFVHGLVSSPAAFKNTINELVPEPWFREHYQVWLYNYPTGNPWIYSSVNFRKKMREACAYARSKGGSENLNHMVIVGHSMGGLLTRSSVTDPGTKMYDAIFRKPLKDLPISPEGKKIIHDATLYKPITEPSRVVFMAVPHQGSPLASRGISDWASRLIHLPKKLSVNLLDSTFLTMGDLFRGRSPVKHLPNSINSLSPSNETTRALSSFPLPRRIIFHSIIGDRGKGNTPQSSDGVVPYWSSHVEPVASEKIVPSDHSVPDNKEAALELKRILKLHLQELGYAQGSQ